MNNLKKIIVSLMLLIPSVGLSSEGWQPYMNMTSNYFEGFGDNHRIVLTMDNQFHNCGWNAAANVNFNIVGPEAFKMYASVILAAWMANKKISVNIQGCVGDRAKIVAMRIGK